MAAVIAAVAVSAAVVVPWYLFIRARHPEAFDILWHEYGASLTNTHPLYFYPVQLLKVLMPWTPWLIGGLCLPFLASLRRWSPDRLRAWLPWIWFVLTVVVFSLSKGKAERYILGIVPAAALLVAGVFEHHLRALDRGEHEAGAGRLLAPHWIVLAGLSIVLVVPAFAGDTLVERGWLDPEAAALPVATAVPLLLALLVIVAWGISASRPFRPCVVAVATGAWMLAASAAWWHLDGSARTWVEDLPDAVAEIEAAAAGANDLGYLRVGDADYPRYELLLQLRRGLPIFRPKKIERLLGKGRPPAVIVAVTDENEHLMTALGYRRVLLFSEGRDRPRGLWIAHPR